MINVVAMHDSSGRVVGKFAVAGYVVFFRHGVSVSVLVGVRVPGRHGPGSVWMDGWLELLKVNHKSEGQNDYSCDDKHGDHGPCVLYKSESMR